MVRHDNILHCQSITTKTPIFLLDLVTVYFGVDLQHLVEMDVETQKLKVKAWLQYVSQNIQSSCSHFTFLSLK